MIELRKVSKNYRHKGDIIPVLKEVDLIVGKGQAFCICGQSGTGKTTLLNIIGCLLAPTSGEVLIADTDIARLPLHFVSSFRRETIGFIFQQFNLLPNYTVMENVLFPFIPSGKLDSRAKKQALFLLEKLGLEERSDFQVKYLSGGEQQRTAVARALVLDPEVIIADEPFSNLDAVNSGIILDIFTELKKRGKTFILSSTASCEGLEKEFVDERLDPWC